MSVHSNAPTSVTPRQCSESEPQGGCDSCTTPLISLAVELCVEKLKSSSQTVDWVTAERKETRDSAGRDPNREAQQGGHALRKP